MEINNIFSYLVYPGKNEKNPEEIRGTDVNLSGKLYSSLEKMFDNAENECEIPIRFIVDENDEQKQNFVRAMIINFINNPNYANGEKLAIRLRDFTTKVPGLGLLFIILGTQNQTKKLVISRFPADQGITANPIKNKLQVEFIEQIFLRNSYSYKAVLYSGTSFDNDFWNGYAIDKQHNVNNEISQYWIKDFLKSDYKTTSKAGTNRLANALKGAINNTKNLDGKQELISLSNLLSGFHGKSNSINGLLGLMNISEESRQQIVSELPHSSSILDDVFVIDKDELLRTLPRRSIELNNGAIMMAPTGTFDDVVKRERIDPADNTYRIYSEGQIVNEKLRG